MEGSAVPEEANLVGGVREEVELAGQGVCWSERADGRQRKSARVAHAGT